ncbi:MAG: lipocalin-like domain-containing protein, partial [Chloroflexota bacterium]
IHLPYGEDPVGYLIYAEDGYMAVSIMHAGRVAVPGADILRRTTQEAAQATRTYLSYSGSYQVLTDRVIHYVKASLFPNWTGTAQERFFAIHECRLYLSTAPLHDPGTAPRADLVWESLPPAPRADSTTV